MASGATLLVFFLMLFLPCAMTLTGDREEDGTDAEMDERDYADPYVRAIDLRLHPPAAIQAGAGVQMTVGRQRMDMLKIPPATPASAMLGAGEERRRIAVQSRYARGRKHEPSAPAALPASVAVTIAESAWMEDARSAAVPRQRRDDRALRDGGEAVHAPYKRRANHDLVQLEVLRARAVAVRAHAEVLAAMARSAQMKANAAADEATEAEHEVYDLHRYIRRAA